MYKVFFLMTNIGELLNFTIILEEKTLYISFFDKLFAQFNEIKFIQFVNQCLI